MKLLEVTRPSDKAAERAKIKTKEEAMKKRVVSAYARALTAPQYKPHPVDVECWLFDIKVNDKESIEQLKAWTDAIGFMINVKINDTLNDHDSESFRTFSYHLNIPHEMVDFVCDKGKFPEDATK